MTAACSCGHPRHATACTGRIRRTAIDGYPWARPCHCTHTQRTLLDRIRGWLA